MTKRTAEDGWGWWLYTECSCNPDEQYPCAVVACNRCTEKLFQSALDQGRREGLEEALDRMVARGHEDKLRNLDQGDSPAYARYGAWLDAADEIRSLKGGGK